MLGGEGGLEGPQLPHGSQTGGGKGAEGDLDRAPGQSICGSKRGVPRSLLGGQRQHSVTWGHGVPPEGGALLLLAELETPPDSCSEAQGGVRGPTGGRPLTQAGSVPPGVTGALTAPWGCSREPRLSVPGHLHPHRPSTCPKAAFVTISATYWLFG